MFRYQKLHVLHVTGLCVRVYLFHYYINSRLNGETDSPSESNDSQNISTSVYLILYIGKMHDLSDYSVE